MLDTTKYFTLLFQIEMKFLALAVKKEWDRWAETGFSHKWRKQALYRKSLFVEWAAIKTVKALIRWNHFWKTFVLCSFYMAWKFIVFSFDFLFHLRTRKHRRSLRQKLQNAICFSMFRMETSSSAPEKLRPHQASAKREAYYLASMKT